MNNFWATWEIDCVMAGIKYDQYLEDHPGPYAPLCEETFKAFAKAIDIQIEKDLGE